EALGPAKFLVYGEAPHGEGGAADVLVGAVRQRLPVAAPPVGVGARHLPAGLPRLPDAEQPDQVEAEGLDRVEQRVGDVVQGGAAAQLAEQDAGVDLVEG